MKLTDPQKKELVKDLADKSYYQAGVNAGLDRLYKNKNSLVTSVRKIYMEVRENPDRFGISTDVIELIENNLKNRNAVKTLKANEIDYVSGNKALKDMEVKEIADLNSKKAAVLLSRKLDIIGASKAELKKTPLAVLAQAYGITFDKRQISLGESTENIAMLAKIDTSQMTTKDLMDALLRVREKNAEQNGNK